MGEIDVKINTLNQSIEKLKALKQSCDAAKKNPPNTVGGGKTIAELEEIGTLYRTMNEHLSSMISGGISFLQMARDGFVLSDRKIGAKLKEK